MGHTEADPHVRARLKHNEIYLDYNARLRNWQVLAFALVGVLGLSLTGWLYSAHQAKTVPYVVEVDQLGRAQSVGPAQEYKLNDEKVIRAFVFQYVDLVRTVVSDTTALKRNLELAYKFSTPTVQGNVLDKYYQGDDPFVYAQKKGTRHIEPQSFLRQGENSYIVEWREIERSYENQVLSETRYKAFISIIQITAEKEDTVKDNPYNPFGIYVTALSWSRML